VPKTMMRVVMAGERNCLWGGTLILRELEGGIEPVERDMDDTGAVEIDEEKCGGALLIIGLEEDSVATDDLAPF
jgi:hypothetical protein